MAPNGETSTTVASVAPFLATIIGNLGSALQRTPSWHEFQGHADDNRELELLVSDNVHDDPEISADLEVVDAECECCGMSEECTPGYISTVRRRFSGRWVCGLCAYAVTEEAGKSGEGMEVALTAHMGVCRRFNGFGRTHRALFQADAMRGILRKLSSLGSPKSSTSPREPVTKGAEKAAPAPPAA